MFILKYKLDLESGIFSTSQVTEDNNFEVC